MGRLRALAAVSLVLVLAVSVQAAPAGKKGGAKGHKHHQHAVVGVVMGVHKDKDADSGTLVLQVYQHRHHGTKSAVAKNAKLANNPKVAKGAAAGQHHHGGEKVHVTAQTKFVRLVHKGKGEKTEVVSFKDVHKGERVRIVLTGDKQHDAKTVDILGHEHHRAVARGAGKGAGKATGQKPGAKGAKS